MICNQNFTINKIILGRLYFVTGQLKIKNGSTGGVRLMGRN